MSKAKEKIVGKDKIHSELGASSADRWMNCAGSVRLSRGLRDKKTSYSIEGDAAHELMERCLKGDVAPTAFFGMELQTVEVDEEMIEAVEVLIGEVKRYMALDPDAVMWCERQFDLARLNPPGPMYGTSDVLIWLPNLRLLVVIDLKYGQGHAVDAVGNPQLKYYGLGATLTLPQGIAPSEVELVIVQPRAAHPDGIIRRHRISLIDLIDFSGELLEKAQATLDPNAPLNPGDWCRWCKAAPTCPALASKALAVAQLEFDPITPQVIEPPPPEALPMSVLLNVLDNKEVLTNWIGSVVAYATAQLESGQASPELAAQWKLVQKRATRYWKDEKDVVEFARTEEIADEQLFSRKLISPAQMEKIVGKKNLPEDLVEKRSSGTTLAPAFDPRPAVGPGHEFTAIAESKE